MVPMTFISLIVLRPLRYPPACGGLALVEACTTVSTLAVEITLAISGLRKSARTNSARPIRRINSGPGGTVSTARTRSISGSAASRTASCPPTKRLAPVTSTTEGDMLLPALARRSYFLSLRRCTRVLRSNLRCFFLDMRLRRFLITEPMLGLLAGRGSTGCTDHCSAAKRPATGANGRPGYPSSPDPHKVRRNRHPTGDLTPHRNKRSPGIHARRPPERGRNARRVPRAARPHAPAGK